MYLQKLEKLPEFIKEKGLLWRTASKYIVKSSVNVTMIIMCMYSIMSMLITSFLKPI